MKDYTTILPDYTIGAHALERLPEICGQESARIFIIGGKKALAASEEKLLNVCEQGRLEVVGTQWYGGECTFSSIERLSAMAKEKKADLILGAGGGKALDTAKGVGFETGLPVFTVPTIAATCAGITSLSVVYKEDHAFDRFLFLKRPPQHCFMDSTMIAEAPHCYLRAGMGDSLAKHFECTMASQGDTLNYSSELARCISALCVEPLLKYGVSALNDAANKRATEALEQVILANIITTGMVSLLIDEDYNGAVAHSLFYGLTLIPGFEENYLHGDVVGYGVLVQLMLEGKEQKLREIYEFMRALKMPLCLGDMKIECSRQGLDAILKETVAGPDMKHLPYAVTEDMIYDAIAALEVYHQKKQNATKV